MSDFSRSHDDPRETRAVGDDRVLDVILETVEHIGDRTSRLSRSVSEGMRAGDALGAVARQLRTLASNTSLEASRLEGSAAIAEIARQMRLLSGQVMALSDQFADSLRSQSVALGELSSAMDALLADTSMAQAMRDTMVSKGRPAEPAYQVGTVETAMTATATEARDDD